MENGGEILVCSALRSLDRREVRGVPVPPAGEGLARRDVPLAVLGVLLRCADWCGHTGNGEGLERTEALLDRVVWTGGDICGPWAALPLPSVPPTPPPPTPPPPVPPPPPPASPGSIQFIVSNNAHGNHLHLSATLESPKGNVLEEFNNDWLFEFPMGVSGVYLCMEILYGMLEAFDGTLHLAVVDSITGIPIYGQSFGPGTAFPLSVPCIYFADVGVEYAYIIEMGYESAPPDPWTNLHVRLVAESPYPSVMGKLHDPGTGEWGESFGEATDHQRGPGTGAVGLWLKVGATVTVGTLHVRVMDGNNAGMVVWEGNVQYGGSQDMFFLCDLPNSGGDDSYAVAVAEIAPQQKKILAYVYNPGQYEFQLQFETDPPMNSSSGWGNNPRTYEIPTWANSGEVWLYTNFTEQGYYVSVHDHNTGALLATVQLAPNQWPYKLAEVPNVGSEDAKLLFVLNYPPFDVEFFFDNAPGVKTTFQSYDTPTYTNYHDANLPSKQYLAWKRDEGGTSILLWMYFQDLGEPISVTLKNNISGEVLEQKNIVEPGGHFQHTSLYSEGTNSYTISFVNIPPPAPTHTLTVENAYGVGTDAYLSIVGYPPLFVDVAHGAVTDINGMPSANFDLYVQVQIGQWSDSVFVELWKSGAKVADTTLSGYPGLTVGWTFANMGNYGPGQFTLKFLLPM